MFKRLVNQLKIDNTKKQLSSASSPMEELKNSAQNAFLKSLSKKALNLYERNADIKNFTKLALSDPQDLSHNNLVKNNKLEADFLNDLINNSEFLKDLGL